MLGNGNYFLTSVLQCMQILIYFFRFVKCIHFPGRPFCVEFVNPHRVNLTKQILKQLQQVILLKFGMFISLHMKIDCCLHL